MAATHDIPGTPLSDETEREGLVTLPDGRVLSYALLGADSGPLVVVLDGPGSRGLARAAAEAAAEAGIRLVAPDRPGFGRSTAKQDRRILDWPDDHAALLGALGAERAGILGQSGGTPFALAAAAALGPRITGLAFAGAIAPFADRRNLAEVDRQMRVVVKLARRAPWLLRMGLRSAARKAADDPAKAAAKLKSDLPPADLAVLEDPVFKALHERASAEILGAPEAFAFEVGLIGREWGVRPEEVRVPVAFWSGDRDRTHPTSHSRRLAALIPSDPPIVVVPEAATFGLRPLYADMLRFAVGG